jgi:heat shock protein HslJ
MPRLLTVVAGLALAVSLVSCGGGGTSSSSSAPLAGTLWSLQKVGAAAAHPGGTLEFVDDRSLQGSSGCNAFHGTYVQSGDSLQITLGPTTLIGCPPDLEAQERAVSSGLEKTSTFTAKGGAMTLLDTSGKPLLVYMHLDSPLLGSNLEVTGVNNGQHAVVSVIVGTSLTAEFGEDGHVTGSAGCNTYGATYTLDGTALHIGPATATRKHCSTPPGVMEQETHFLHALERSTTVEASGSVIALRDAQNAIQVTFHRSG